MTLLAGTRLWDHATGLRTGTAHLDEEARITALSEPQPSVDVPGLVIPAPTNAHTHLADHALRGQAQGLTLEETVAPPDGLKHRFLREATTEAKEDSFRQGLQEVQRSGAHAAIDFREGGPQGAKIAQQASQASPVHLTILGRPTTPEAWHEEAPRLLDLADGIGVSGLNDQPHPITQAQADACHGHDKPLALHISEARREDLDAALALDPAFLVHGTRFNEDDVKTLAQAGTPLVVCPRANALFGNTPPIEAIHEAGVSWSIGTDNALFHEANVWADVQWLATRYAHLGATTLLEAATMNPLDPSPPRLQEGTPVVVLDDADGLDHALRQARVTDPRRNPRAHL